MPFLPVLCSKNEKIKDVKLHLLYVDSIDTLFIESLRATQLQLSFGFPYWVGSGVDDRGNSAATFFAHSKLWRASFLGQQQHSSMFRVTK